MRWGSDRRKRDLFLSILQHRGSFLQGGFLLGGQTQGGRLQGVYRKELWDVKINSEKLDIPEANQELLQFAIEPSLNSWSLLHNCWRTSPSVHRAIRRPLENEVLYGGAHRHQKELTGLRPHGGPQSIIRPQSGPSGEIA
ncbi:Hypothetical protein FKW44_020540 [Caligus rogercresseyi]|uniref:Uncharacterized protein n=1 Tax=Caligus rogercresseyi TaxID=217165 RepID=A0A7T8GXY5_CALRO|nr:Hypothetical protein FKW44_020540 [Caligus rogercresseyi]